MFRLCWIVSVLICVSGCTDLEVAPENKRTIHGLDQPLMELQHLVTSLSPTGLRSASANGREFYSKYFVVDKGPTGAFKPALDAADRYWAQCTILGDHRPYDIEIFVVHERRVLNADDTHAYVNSGYDNRLAKQLELQLRQELTKRREDRNIIDDFRVF